jgi:O-antigen/teichoic acid export membrane protein
MSELEISSLKTIAKGATIFFIGMLLSKIVAFIYRVFAARYFGPADYGMFSIGLAVIGFFGVVAVLGLDSGVGRYVPFYRARDDEKRVRSVLLLSIKIVTLISIILLIVLILLSPYIATTFFNPEFATTIIILAISIPFTALTTIFLQTYLGFQKVKYQAYSSVVLNVVKLATVVMFAFIGFGAIGLAWSWTTAVIIAFLFSFYLVEKKVYPVFRSRTETVPMKKELLTFSLPLVLGSVASVTLSWTDTLLLGFFKTSIDVGVYNAVTPLMQLLLVVPFAFTAIFTPVFAELYSKGMRDEMKKIYKTVTKWIFYINFPFFLLMAFFPKQILTLFFGAEYASGYLALIILSTANISISLALCSLSVLIVLKKTKHVTYITAGSSLINVILNVFLIQNYGIQGAALATGITIVLGNSLMLLFSWHFTKTVPLSKSLLKSVLAGILSLGSVFYMLRILFVGIPVYVLIASFAVFLALYWFLLLLFKSFDKSDLEILSVIERKVGIKIGFMRRFI